METMRVPGKVLKGLGVGLVAAVVAFVVVRTWVVPTVIVGQIQAKTGGKVRIRDWWLNGTSAGVVGLSVSEGPAADAPVWASSGRVSTDLSLGGLLRGRFAPRRIRLREPEVSLRFDEKGKLLTKIGGAPGGGAGPVPLVSLGGAKITLRQEGRPAMVVTGVSATLVPARGRVLLTARSYDPEWGPLQAHGETDAAFQTGTIELKTTGTLTASPEKVKAIPFVPADVWKNVAPSGKVGVALNVSLDHGAVHVRTEIGLRGTSARSEALDLLASRTTGRVIVEDTLVTFKDVSGEAIDGRVTANGSADFGKAPARFDLNLRLDRINVADAPKSWQLDEAGLTGRLSGDVRLLALLTPGGVDLSGTSGDAVVESGTIQGIPFKSLKLVMKASGNDLQYGTSQGKTSAAVEDGSKTPQPRRPDRSKAPGASLSPYQWLAGLAAIALQAPEAKKDAPEAKNDAPRKPGVQLPKSIVTHLELEDVDIVQLVAKAKFLLGFPFPVPITGRLSLNADATIPLGKGSTIKDYQFHGDLKLTRTSIYNVDLGRVSARVDFADGAIDLTNLRGRLVDHPDGGPDNPPPAEGPEVPASGPLPPGAFRGTLHAAFSPPGKLTAKFDGNLLPLGELAAPALPRPTPLSGLATLTVRAEADLGAAGDPAAWTASGTVESQQMRYRGAALERVAGRFGLKGGRLDVPELTALLRGRPLKARAGIDLKPPRAFQGMVDVAGWDLAEILAWVPQAPRPAPVAGTLSARAEASGTLSPLSVKTDGRGSFERFQAGPVALGAVPFHWTTRGDVVSLAVTDARPFGGRLSAEADVPLTPGKPIHGGATVEAIDTAALSAAIPGGSLKLTGLASGKVTFSLPADVSKLDAAVKLSAPDLTVQGIPAEQVKATVRAERGALGYEVSADSLGGVIKLNGTFPLGAAPISHNADGELRAVGFTLDRVWKSFGLTGVASRLTGRGAVDANLRAVLGGPTSGLYAHGVAELRDLSYKGSVPLGRLRGVLTMTPDGWRVDRLGGDLLGGVVSGFLWESNHGDPVAPAKRQVGFNVRVDRAELIDAAAFLPVKGLKVQGYGTLRAAGTLGDVLRASGDLFVAAARVGGLPIAELKVPAEVATTGGSGAGVVHLRRYSAKVAGGHVHGDAWFHVGIDRAFQGDMNLTDVDLESITRVQSDSNRPPSGKISGRVSLSGHDLTQTRGYRGKVNLRLDDAALVAVPVFRELDRFLGSATGGLFEAGELNGTIANRQLVIESATLMGRLAQLHISGTVGFDSQLNLEVLVNTNQLIPQAGSALVSALPGLRGGRNSQASLEASNYLSNRLLKLRVTGTLRSPSVNMDPGVVVAGSAVGFFSGVLKLPLGLVK